MVQRYEVVFRETGWLVTCEGVTLSRHATQDAAIGSGAEHAGSVRPSQLLIHHADGVVARELRFTVPRFSSAVA